MDLMSQWVEEAAAADPEDYNAMCIATQSLAGESTVGCLLGRWKWMAFAFSPTMSLRREGIVGLTEHCLHLFWKELERQVRIRGRAIPSSAAVSDSYFASRPRSS